MFMSFDKIKSDPKTEAWPVLEGRRFVPVVQTPRGEHARMLTIAAARRLRALERAGLHRDADALYWKEAAPFAIAKAASYRTDPLFHILPA